MRRVEVVSSGCVILLQDMKLIEYRGTVRAREITEEVLANKEAKILDIGAGTGLVGEQVKSFKNRPPV